LLHIVILLGALQGAVLLLWLGLKQLGGDAAAEQQVTVSLPAPAVCVLCELCEPVESDLDYHTGSYMQQGTPLHRGQAPLYELWV